MKAEEFILRVVEAYRDARIPVIKDKKISRGRSRSVSSVAEDLFAYYLIKNDSAIENIFVDQSIYFADAKKSIYPDITVVKNGIVTAFIDLKMDMGWKRNELLNLCKKHGQTVTYAKGGRCRLKDGQTKEAKELKVSKSVSYSIVIISRRNSGNQLDTLRAGAKKLKPSVETFLLCDSPKYHPNQYGIKPKALVQNLEVDTTEFNRLLTILN